MNRVRRAAIRAVAVLGVLILAARVTPVGPTGSPTTMRYGNPLVDSNSSFFRVRTPQRPVGLITVHILARPAYAG